MILLFEPYEKGSRLRLGHFTGDNEMQGELGGWMQCLIMMQS